MKVLCVKASTRTHDLMIRVRGLSLRVRERVRVVGGRVRVWVKERLRVPVWLVER